MSGLTVQAQNLAFASVFRRFAEQLETTDLRCPNSIESLTGIARNRLEWALYEVGGPKPEAERISGYETIEIDNGLRPIFIGGDKP